LSRLAHAFALAAGELEALLLMSSVPHAILLTDDAAARVVAGQLGYAVHGTLGIIIRALRRQQRTKRQVLNLLSSIRRKSTLHLAEGLLNSIIEQVHSL
jgi:predicted nucleic acid-binding protein